MSLRLIPYEPAHIFAIDIIDAQKPWRDQEGAPTLAAVMAKHPAWTVVDDEGVLVMCGGVACQENGVYVAWIMCGKAIDKHTRPLVRLVRATIDRILTVIPRIEARFVPDAVKARRFAEAVGLPFVEERDTYVLHVRT